MLFQVLAVAFEPSSPIVGLLTIIRLARRLLRPPYRTGPPEVGVDPSSAKFKGCCGRNRGFADVLEESENSCSELEVEMPAHQQELNSS